ncbi:KTSC domain-containing protein [bacterium]|nr:KTSC domain-containing protein [bacterium]
MNRTPVSSSDIASVGYDPATEILEIEFHSGGLYWYYLVPVHIHSGLMSASSRGKFLHQNIKGSYRYTRM